MAARITRMTKRRLGEILMAEGLVTEEQVEVARAEQRKSNFFLSEALVRLGFVTEDSIACTIAQQFNLPYIGVEQYEIPNSMLDIYPEILLREYQFLPMEKMGNVLCIVGAGLMNHDVLDELERLANCKVCQYVGRWIDIRNAIDRLFKDRPKESQDALTDLGSMLLDGDASDVMASGFMPPPGMEEQQSSSADLAATVESLTGGNMSDVLQEALAALDQGDVFSTGEDSFDLNSPAPAVELADPSLLDQNLDDDADPKRDRARATKPVQPIEFPGTKGKMSAFKAGTSHASGIRRGVSATEDEKGSGSKSGQEGRTEDGVVKGGLLGFLKKK